MAALLFQTFILFAFWMILSGIFDAFHLAIGLLAAVFFTVFDWLYDKNTSSKGPAAVKIPRYVFKGFLYSIWVLKSILLAALHVSKLILSPQMKLNPKLILHETSLNGDVAKTIFANSITLTPGTITGNVEGKTFTVHQLDDAASEDILSGTMEKEIQKIYGDPV